MTDSRLGWDEVWMGLAVLMGQRSRCIRAQVGAVVVTQNNKVVASGYNGPPAGYMVIGNCSNFCLRAQASAIGNAVANDYSDCPSTHAEPNALLHGDATLYRGGTIYSSSSTCFGCAKLIANSGIKRLVHRVEPGMPHRDPKKTETFLRACGLTVDRWVP